MCMENVLSLELSEPKRFHRGPKKVDIVGNLNEKYHGGCMGS